jgi:hypothetical protein
VGLEVQLFHPKRIIPTSVRKQFSWPWFPEKFFEGVGRMAIPWFIDQDASQGGEARAETITVAYAKQAE